METIYRQGDVLIRAIDSLPKDCSIRKNGILAYGEATGHAHRISNVAEAEVLEVGNNLYLRVGEDGVRIIHDEHSPIVLAPGNYEVTIQKEYTPAAIRNVTD